MKHLNTEDIIKYVTINTVNNETLELMSKVNGHIRNCPSCKEKVMSYESINNELKKEILKNGFDLNRVDDLMKINKNIELTGGYSKWQK